MDRYSKIVLTIIAAALVGLLVQHALPGARAQTGECGVNNKQPCAVYLVYQDANAWKPCITDGQDKCK